MLVLVGGGRGRRIVLLGGFLALSFVVEELAPDSALRLVAGFGLQVGSPLRSRPRRACSRAGFAKPSRGRPHTGRSRPSLPREALQACGGDRRTRRQSRRPLVASLARPWKMRSSPERAIHRSVASPSFRSGWLRPDSRADRRRAQARLHAPALPPRRLTSEPQKHLMFRTKQLSALSSHLSAPSPGEGGKARRRPWGSRSEYASIRQLPSRM